MWPAGRVWPIAVCALLAAGVPAAAALAGGGGGAIVAGGVLGALAGAAAALLMSRRRDRMLADASGRMLRALGRDVGAEGSDPARSLLLAADTIERRAGELRRQRGALETVIDAQTDPAFITDANGRIARCNGAASEWFGEEAGRLVGRPLHETFTRAEIIALHDEARSGRAGRLRATLPTPAGERTFDVVVTPLPPEPEGHAAVTVLRDVTELAETARVKTDFVANASHELRTPVAAIRAAIETLDSAQDDPQMLHRVAGMMAKQVSRLEELTRDLLDLSRVESNEVALRIEPLRLDELLATLRAEFEQVCRERSLEISMDVDRALDGARTDPRLLLLILRNLIENSTKFCDGGTTVQVVGRLDESEARFEVRDRGVGIPLNQQQRVFERFYQVDLGRHGAAAPVAKGTGLGLAIVRHAVRAMGGQVGLESVWKQGTTVWVEIPIPTTAPLRSPARPGPHPPRT